MSTETVGHMTLKPGDVIEFSDVKVTILRHPDDAPDLFDRPLKRFWSRREDTGAEGYVSFGVGGVAELVSRRPSVLVKCGSHRARKKLMTIFSDVRDAEGLYSLLRDTGKGVYRIPADREAEAKAIVGVTGFRDSDDLMRTWPSKTER